MAKDTNKYIESVGRRKTAIARVRMTPAKSTGYKINDQKLEEAFPVEVHRKMITDPLLVSNIGKDFEVSVKVYGGGMTAQADAVRLGIARILVKIDESFRPALKEAGFLKRDPRVKERRKFGLKKARKAPQWSKR